MAGPVGRPAFGPSMYRNEQVMRATFHGVRGSVPVSAPEYTQYGGHTTCLEFRSDGVQVIVDAGSGFQNVKIAEEGPVILMFSHFHHDHIQGLAFNSDLLRLNREVFVTSALCDGDTVREYLQTYFHGAYFPIDLIGLMGQIRFVDFSELAAIFTGVMEAASMPLAHPGGSAAYSIAMEGARVCTLFDNEYAAVQEAQLADFVDGSDLVSWDGMFLEEELQMRRGWGHSSIEEGVDFFTRTGARQMALMHHAPSRTDQQLDSLQDGLKQDKIFFAHQNQTIELQGSRRQDTR